MTIGALIQNRRKELKLTLEEVGKEVGVDRATVMRWEKGLIQKMGRDKISALCKVLHLDPMLFVQPAEVLFEDEQKLLNAYRDASPEIRSAALTMLEDSANARKKEDTAQKAI